MGGELGQEPALTRAAAAASDGTLGSMTHRAFALLLVALVACTSGAHGGVHAAGTDASQVDARASANMEESGTPREAAAAKPLHIVVFSKTSGYRHDSIGPATTALTGIAAKHKATLESTEDAALLTTKLASASVVVFLMTTGDVLDDAQQAELEHYMRDGGGFVGVHSSADTEYDWPFYRELNGAWFANHPTVQPAQLIIDAPDNDLVSFLPREWARTDEWYNFQDNPRARGVTVLLRLDERSYTGGTHGEDHPIAWSHVVGRGRAFYTGLGHTQESWQEALFLQHVERGLLWAAGK